MPALKAGTVKTFGNSMASYIDDAMRSEWQAVKGDPLPAGLGEEDRKILFAAIAQGVLKFLFDHREDLITKASGGESHTHIMNFTISISGE